MKVLVPQGPEGSGVRLSTLSFKSLLLKNGSTECNQFGVKEEGSILYKSRGWSPEARGVCPIGEIYFKDYSSRTAQQNVT